MSLSKKCNLTVALMTAVVAVAQAGDIKGVVIDKEMNEPLMGCFRAHCRYAHRHYGRHQWKFSFAWIEEGNLYLGGFLCFVFPPETDVASPGQGECGREGRDVY